MIIIKYFEWLIHQPDIRSVVYEMLDNNFKNPQEIDKEKAMKLAKDNGLKIVHKNKFGTIWR